MCGYALELPHCPVFVFVLDEADDIIVSHYFFKSVVVDRTQEFDSVGLVFKINFVVLDCADYASFLRRC
jgi:hypothetical protein